VLPLYEAARAEALKDPGPAPAGWAPDAWVAVSSTSLDELLVAVLAADAELSTHLDAGIATFTPRLNVSDVQILPPEGCGGCLTVNLALTGTLEWSSAIAQGSTSLTAGGKFDAIFEVVQEGATFRVDLRAKKLRDVSASLGQSRVGLPVGEISQWLSKDLLDAVPPIPITSFDGTDLPVRAVRVVPVGRSIRVEALTKAPLATAVPPPERVTDGWRVGLSQPSLLALARAAAFRKGPLAHDVVAEPTALDIGKDRFTLGLRLWRVAGKGWWRDYTVMGKVNVGRDGIDLVPDQVVEGPKSPGAVFSDPLAALGEGRILEAIEDALAITLPTRQSTEVGSVHTNVALTGLDPSGTSLFANGTLNVVGDPAGGRGGRAHPQRR
jgi:hypothetical protein